MKPTWGPLPWVTTTCHPAAINNATPSAPKMKTKIEDRGLKIEDRLARNDVPLDPRSSTDPANRLRGEESLNVAVREPITQVPADSQDDDLRREPVPDPILGRGQFGVA